ncbi:NADH-FMN oxidoreductase RutF, flavin reductase (DIM6/NTAB) family [Actinokineospora diospyrosa]|uniref:NADH-FMN oxidoreductase RutF, flavin reductase (DIM6/NTAB) family n=2 Tax=Actinokineospora diospyrosa TaxID=103728 RepID=A0ABT1I5E4_9PSEU|nr:NADH-FMN oxidoreductase RutF, flavin reductase (DIM6/NTAB) family [Actinokineospora diospyrosa]
MGVDLRVAMRNFATGVCVMTTRVDGPNGPVHDAVTVNSLTSLSLDPPLVSVCLRSDSVFLADLLVSGHWALSILDIGASDVARAFAAGREHRRTALATVSAVAGEHTGALVLDGPGWLECGLRQAVEVGDHTLLIGDVLATGSQDRRPPLVFLHGEYHAVGAGGAARLDREVRTR